MTTAQDNDLSIIKQATGTGNAHPSRQRKWDVSSNKRYGGILLDGVDEGR